VRSGNLFGDLGQGRIVCPGILEPVFRYRDGVRAAAPFPNQTRAGLQAEARRGANPARCPQAFAIVCSFRRTVLPSPPCAIS
jgi:hypothetical protein